VGLGEKRSELPFSKGDEELLSAMAASGSVTLETLRRRGLDAFEMTQHEAFARECPKCFQIADPKETTCTNCASPTNLSSIPRKLAGKFLFEKRIGSGAMGVVYRATDLALGRAVAIKTLPQTSPEGAVHLRREARAMAKIVHPNLAMIFGAETWKGLPLLVFEFLEAGTLADRLEKMTVPILETIAVGVAMSNVLHKTHSTGLLHGDVKPSNIGFNSEGVPKLLDFGLARLYGNRSATLPGNLDGEDPTRIKKATFLVTGLAGTPLFMPPEVLSGEAPDPSSDLWALTLVMYEALTRRNPFQRKTWAESKKAILEGSPPDVREVRPECPAPLAVFIDSELSKSRVLRSTTAKDFQRRLSEVETAL
jgi:serine/threonine protein kinase